MNGIGQARTPRVGVAWARTGASVLAGAAALAVMLGAAGCAERSAQIGLGTRLNGESASLKKVNLAYAVRRADGTGYRAAFLRFNNDTSRAGVHFSDPEVDGEDGVLVVAGVRPVTGSSRVIAAARSTVFLHATSEAGGGEDVVAVLEAEAKHDAVVLFARREDGTRGPRLATLTAGTFARVSAGGRVEVRPIGSDTALSERAAAWHAQARRLWNDGTKGGGGPAPAPGGGNDPDPDDPAPPIPPKKPDQPVKGGG